jgi:hypothetical protein
MAGVERGQFGARKLLLAQQLTADHDATAVDFWSGSVAAGRSKAAS